MKLRRFFTIFVFAVGLNVPTIGFAQTEESGSENQPPPVEMISSPAEIDEEPLELVTVERRFVHEPIRVTTHPAEDFQPSVSPDGKTLAFVSDRSGNLDIWIRSLDQGSFATPKQVTIHTSVDKKSFLGTQRGTTGIRLPSERSGGRFISPQRERIFQGQG